MNPDQQSDEALIEQALNQLAGFLESFDRLLLGSPEESNNWVSVDNLSPAGTVVRLKMLALHQYIGVLRLVQDPYATSGAEVLCRALLENLAHMYWIERGEPLASTRTAGAKKNRCLGILSDPDSTPASRSTCLELGTANLFAANLQNASVTPQRSALMQQTQQWVTDVTAKHAYLGCAGHGRDYKDVQWSLKSFVSEMKTSWPLDLWYASSATAHQLMPQRLARQVDGVTYWGGPAPKDDRVLWLSIATYVTINIYLFAMGILKPEKLGEFQDIADQATAVVQALQKP